MRARTAPMVIGHRGAPGYRPEHTRGSYELALQLRADAVEPDIVATKDGVLVLRHENEISGTTDVAGHPEFADRRTTKEIDGVALTGWFTEDFTWDELSTLRARERIPALRQNSSTFDGHYPLLRLRDLLELIERAGEAPGRSPGLVAELKHATYFEAAGLPLDELLLAEFAEAGWSDRPGVVVESFERTVLGQLHARGFRGRRVYLLEGAGAPADRVAALGSSAPGYDSDLTLRGLYALGSAAASPGDRVDGISVETSQVLSSGSVSVALFGEDDAAEVGAVTSDLVDLAHSAGLAVFCWTLRPENGMLPPEFRTGGPEAEWGDWRRFFSILLHSGVDGVFADHPDLAVSVRDGL
ncbi:MULTISPECIES: glycerophosphodiester phosphodiesterase family protein [unclassified Leifsonia]|uniref:glycerophosphodiester phosphodiesterase family protein n=1 Tax=unclassified Leifsonia TaxID=2663824 RepID=UPI0008A76BB2|nr:MULTISPECIES: glycerophosphodiester phosphodiesterase family protein [unclassified Leifsonia]SEH69565.1 glycerophosphoryl diester phosphodiesterase [Leifsonia sp. CL154]SFL30895.1 glycerophosphoryl diester phosphodiesterase [Leifsonia sp. CL147]